MSGARDVSEASEKVKATAIGSPDPRLPAVWFLGNGSYGVKCDCGYLTMGWPIQQLAERDQVAHVRSAHGALGSSPAPLDQPDEGLVT